MEEKSRLKRLLEAIEFERKIEENYFSEIAAGKSKADKIESGYLLYPIKIIKQHYTLGEYVELVLEAPQASTPRRSRFREGVGCMLVSEGEETRSFKGTVSRIRKNNITILLKADVIEKQSLFYTAKLGLEQIYDERPYKVMANVIEKVMASQSNHVKEIRYAIDKGTFFRYTPLHPKLHFDFPDKLNDSQKEAIKKCVQTPYVSVIHGPPGTGKTTTLVALIRNLLKVEKRIVVCAPSNNASDLLAFLLDQIGVNVLRVGNLSRIGDRISHLTIEEKARGDKEWNNIKKIKVKAADVRKRARAFKRSFDKKDYYNRKSLLKEAKDLNDWARDLESKLVDSMLDKCQVIVSTLIGIEGKYTSDLTFDTAIIDEASQSLEPECWTAILKSKRVILAGDHKQLPPTVKGDRAKEYGLETTLLDQLAGIKEISTMLNVQYRMHEKILSFSNEQFYEDDLKSHESVASRTLHDDNLPFQLIDTIGTGFDENFNQDQKSYNNEGEYFIISEHVNAHRERLLGASIGIVSPYSEQVGLIKNKIEDDAHFKDMDVEVNSIDGFQGQEKDVIYISFVRSNDAGNIGFLKDQRRLNVAMTRARKKLVLVGNMVTLSSDPIFEKLVAYAESIEAYTSAWEYMSY